MQINLRIEGEGTIFVITYNGESRRVEEINSRFWEKLTVCLKGFIQSERTVVLGDLKTNMEDILFREQKE